MNILYIDDENLPKRWYDEQNSIHIATNYKDAIKYLQKYKFEVIDIRLDLESIPDGCDIVRYIIQLQLDIPYIYIRSNNIERRNNMLKLLKRFTESNIQYY